MGAPDAEAKFEKALRLAASIDANAATYPVIYVCVKLAIRYFNSYLIAGIPWFPTEELAFGKLINFSATFIHRLTVDRLFVMGSGIKLSPMGEPLETVSILGFTY